jgi:hypothetical protein
MMLDFLRRDVLTIAKEYKRRAGVNALGGGCNGSM